MSARVIRPSKIAPKIPSDVALFLHMETHRHQLAFEGDTADSDAVLTDMENELDALFDEGNTDEATSWRIARLSTLTYMILCGLQNEIRKTRQSPDMGVEPDMQFSSTHAYANLLRSGLEIASWENSWVASRYGAAEWPSEEHAVCAGVAAKAEFHLGSAQKVLELADLLDQNASDMAA